MDFLPVRRLATIAVLFGLIAGACTSSDGDASSGEPNAPKPPPGTSTPEATTTVASPTDTSEEVAVDDTALPVNVLTVEGTALYLMGGCQVTELALGSGTVSFPDVADGLIIGFTDNRVETFDGFATVGAFPDVIIDMPGWPDSLLVEGRGTIGIYGPRDDRVPVTFAFDATQLCDQADGGGDLNLQTALTLTAVGLGDGAELGSDPDDVIAFVTKHLGPPSSDKGWGPDPFFDEAEFRYVSFGEGYELTLWFGDRESPYGPAGTRHFRSYTQRGSEIVHVSGLRVGETSADVIAVFGSDAVLVQGAIGGAYLYEVHEDGTMDYLCFGLDGEPTDVRQSVIVRITAGRACTYDGE
jgi:hypothetical protein